MVLRFIKTIIKSCEKNNKILILLWIWLSSHIIYYIIILLIFLNILSLLKYLISKNFYPNKNILDNIIFKFIQIKHNKFEIIKFFLFGYLFIFITGISLKSIKISIDI